MIENNKRKKKNIEIKEIIKVEDVSKDIVDEIPIVDKKDETLENIKTDVNSLHGKIILINVGSSEDPATNDDISDVREQFEKLLEKHNVNCLLYVTHHLVSIKIVE